MCFLLQRQITKRTPLRCLGPSNRTGVLAACFIRSARYGAPMTPENKLLPAFFDFLLLEPRRCYDTVFDSLGQSTGPETL